MKTASPSSAVPPLKTGTTPAASAAAAGEKTPGCLVAIYTGASPQKQTQNLAFSRDGGATWTKYPGNPVLDLGLKDFRDPKVFWHAASKSWVMVVALPTQHKVRFYRSEDLRQWELAGEFGPAGAVSGVWECPDLFELPVRDDKGNLDSTRWLLSVNVNPGGPAGGSAISTSSANSTAPASLKIIPAPARTGPIGARTSTPPHPSPTSRPISDPIWIAWMDNWQYARQLPSLPGRGEMTAGPQPLSARAARSSRPNPRPGAAATCAASHSAHPRLQTLRSHVRRAGLFTPSPEANARLAKSKPAGSVYVLRFEIAPGEAAQAGIRLRRSSTNPNEPAQEETVVGIDTEKGQIFLDRTRSGKTDWSPDFPARIVAPLKHPQETAVHIEIVVDKNSVEVFADDGETVLTSLIYPSEASQGLASLPAHFPRASNPPASATCNCSPSSNPPRESRRAKANGTTGFGIF